MSAAPAETVVDGEAPAAPAKKGRKKLIVIAAAALLVLASAGGGGAFYIMKKRAAAVETVEAVDADGETVSVAEAAPARKKEERRKTPPVFLPLDPFIVNLADRDAEKFAQIGITLELDDAKFGEELKLYMPAIRNGVLMVLAHKTSQQLLGRKGKEALAAEIMREAVRPLGIEIEEETEAATDKDGEDAKPRATSKGGDANPVRRVHFSSFIIQ
jgi:flagellar FliL protein